MGKLVFQLFYLLLHRLNLKGKTELQIWKVLCLPFLTQNVEQCATVDKQMDSESANLRFNAVFLTKQ